MTVQVKLINGEYHVLGETYANMGTPASRGAGVYFDPVDMPGTVYFSDGTTWTKVSSGGAAHVTTTIYGSPNSYMMAPAGATASGATNILSDSTGFKQFWAQPSVALGSGVALLVASSTVAGDSTNLAAILDAAATAYATPDGIANPGVLVITDDDKAPQVQPWDGTNTIKTIAMRLTGTGTAIATTLNTVS